MLVRLFTALGVAEGQEVTQQTTQQRRDRPSTCFLQDASKRLVIDVRGLPIS